ncbi:MAG: AraC family transcriptional regulator [Flavobacterium sp.]|uniref:GyrI-like domain-containing protein n=1 Tax=Flavobacterium sp. TaxID=239 RepID=UPI0012027D64|nr:GyrI-like domain-containing protein [Flavobacterium sp.]RZJ65738.1 MAG: AraC family transcriptional regulator [Flavobacterium sp.]
MIGREFTSDNFRKFVAKGKLPDAVAKTWSDIWQTDKELNRKYICDYEVYGDTTQNGEDSEVEIFIAVK